MLCTGVYRPSERRISSSDCLEPLPSPLPSELCECGGKEVDHGHRDLPFTEEMTRADHVVHDVKSAIDKIFEMEGFYSSAN